MACFTETSHLYVDGIYRAHGLHVTWSPKVIPFLDVNIPYESTLGAHEVVMAVRVRIKPRSLPQGSHPRDEPLPFEQSQRSVHGIERKGRDPLAHPGINRLRIRMLIRASELTIDL